MDLTVQRNDLVRELHLVQGIVERKNSIPILSSPRRSRGRGPQDLGHRPRRVPPVRLCGPVSSPGAITLAAKKLYEIVRSLPESDVRIKVLPDAWASIECERTSFRMAGLPREDFPVLPEGKGARAVGFPGTCCGTSSARTAFAVTARTGGTTSRAPC